MNDRLLILDEDVATSFGTMKQLVAWDSKLGRVIPLTPFHISYFEQEVGGPIPSPNPSVTGPVEQGSWIVWQGVDGNGQVTLNIIDSATLPG